MNALFFDADNVGSDRHTVLAAVISDALRTGGLDLAVFAGRDLRVVESLGAATRLSLPRAEVVECVSVPKKNSADVLLAFHMGRFAGRVTLDSSLAYVMTCDSLVLYAASELVRFGRRLVILPRAPRTHVGDALHHVLQLHQPDEASDTSLVDGPGMARLPSRWSTDGSPMPDTTGLIVVAVPGSEGPSPTPGFIALPDGQPSVTVGRAGDVPLGAWERPGERSGLYPAHVRLTYESGHWGVLSLRGLRRGGKAVFVDGRHIHAAHGRVPLPHGSDLQLGLFRFRFHECRRRSIADFEDPKEVVARIERALRGFADAARDATVPPEIHDALGASGLQPRWENAYLRHYETLIRENLETPSFKALRAVMPSRSAVSRSLGSLNRIRNTAMHPSRPALDARDRERLAQLATLLLPALGVVP